MKSKIKSLLVAFGAVLCTFTAGAQDLNILNHLSVGVNVGTTGVGVDVAVPLTSFISIRPGYNWMPKISPKVDFDVVGQSQNVPAGINIPKQVEFQGDLHFSGAKMLVDLYPIPKCGFHLTAGAYFGQEEIVTLYNTQDGAMKSIADYNNSLSSSSSDAKIGVELGDYKLTPDARGNVNATLNTKKVRPYVGLGFGRAVPGSRLGFMFELGAQFWGHPAVYCNGQELVEDKVGNGDAGKIIKTLSKISVYPVINFRLCGKIF